MFSRSYILVNLLKTEVHIAIRKNIILKQSFLILNIVFLFFNVNEHPVVPIVKLARVESRVEHLHLLYLHWSTYVIIPTVLILLLITGLILLLEIFPVTCVLLSVYLYGWSNWNVSLVHLTITNVSGDHM